MQLTVNGVLYETVAPVEVEHRYGQATIFSIGAKKVVNHCEACGRFDVVPDDAHSWDEVIERGWAVPVTGHAPESP